MLAINFGMFIPVFFKYAGFMEMGVYYDKCVMAALIAGIVIYFVLCDCIKQEKHCDKIGYPTRKELKTRKNKMTEETTAEIDTFYESMNLYDKKALEKDMYDTANRIVGRLGQKINIDSLNSKLDGVAQFCICRINPNYLEIMNVWTKWINAYNDFKKLDRHTERLDLSDDPDTIIRWLQKPVIDSDKFSESSSSVFVRAVLSIDRTDSK